MWHQFALALSLVLVGAWFAFGQQVAFTNESLAKIKEHVESKQAVLLDVREQEEWDHAHVKRAILVPMSIARDHEKCAAALSKLDKSKPIYCHCKKGGRALIFAELVQGMGYDVRPMKQPFAEIAQCGLEIVFEAKEADE